MKPDDPLEIRAELQPGLRDLDGFSHLHLITRWHRAARGGLERDAERVHHVKADGRFDETRLA
jgi:tRNA (Thr-GGU) A37 N-methylase